MLLAGRANYDKKTLTRRVASLAPGYRTALLSSPVPLYSGNNTGGIHTPRL